MLLRFGSELFPVSCGALRSFVAESIVPIWTGACDIGHIGLRRLGWGEGGGGGEMGASKRFYTIRMSVAAMFCRGLRGFVESPLCLD